MTAERTHLEDLIDQGEIAGKLIFPGVPTPTVPDAAGALGVEEGQILKSLVFTNRRGDYVLAIAAGPDRVSAEKLAAASGIEGLKLARPDDVLEHTGYPVGAMPPVAHQSGLPVFVDQAVTKLEVVYGGGGRVDAMLQITPDEIVRVTGATVTRITT